MHHKLDSDSNATASGSGSTCLTSKPSFASGLTLGKLFNSLSQFPCLQNGGDYNSTPSHRPVETTETSSQWEVFTTVPGMVTARSYVHIYK